jgi:hypothetical protein
MEMCSLFHKFGVASLIPTASIRCKKGGVNNNSIARATTTVLKNHIGTTPRVLKLISTDTKKNIAKKEKKQWVLNQAKEHFRCNCCP